VAPATLPNGTVGVAYAQTIAASGSTGPFTFTVTSGTLPAGLRLSTSGALSGTPTAAGAFAVTVTATNATNESGSQPYTLTVDPGSSPPPPGVVVGDFFAAPSGQDEGRGGRSIAVGDVSGDGVADLIVTGDNLLGTGSQVVVFSGADLAAGEAPGFGATVLANFSAAGQSPTALVSVAAVDADGDGRADVAVGSGAGQPSLVKVYPGKDLSGTAEPASTSFDPFGTTTLDGVFLG
jgi:hypothetical protein